MVSGSIKKRRKREKRIKQILIFLGIAILAILLGVKIFQGIQKRQEEKKAALENQKPVLEMTTEPTDTLDSNTPATIEGLTDDTDTSDQSSVSTPTAGVSDFMGNIPTEELKDAPEPPTIADTTLVFTGDVLLSNYVLANYDAAGIDGVVTKELRDVLTDADITMINNEFPFSTRGTQAPDKQFTFRVDPERIGILQELGVDIASLANNHALDYGTDALSDTFTTFDEAGIHYSGAGESKKRAQKLISIEKNERTYGFLSATRVIPVTSWNIENQAPGLLATYDPGILLSAIEEADASCDFLTVFVHWGIEREAYPEDYQVTMAKQYIDAGADLVIGAHPHVLQGIEYYNGKPIFYSLGNFIFNQEIGRSMAVSVTIPEGDCEKPVISVVPAAATGACTSRATGTEGAEILSYLESISVNAQVDAQGLVTEVK